MARTPSRVSERKLIQVGSIWTNGTDDVRVVKVDTYGEYKYVTYKYTHKRKAEGQLDDLTFALRFTAKTVRAKEIKALEPVAAKSADEGKVKMVGWAG